MKFAHRLKAELLEQGYPQHWVDSAVPYGQLKKVINKICRELKEYGLDITTFVHLPPEPDADPQGAQGGDRKNSNDGAVAFQYDLSGSQKEFHPKLTLFFEDDKAVDATLSPDTKAFLKIRLSQQGHREGDAEKTNQGAIPANSGSSALSKQAHEQSSPERENQSKDGPVLRQIEVPLTFDAEFFALLREDVTHLDAIQAEEHKALTDEIHELSKEITSLAKPSKFNKTDMYGWRQLFDLYLQAGVFFSTSEGTMGTRSTASAAQQLEWFQNEVTSRGLVSGFKLPASHRALDRFVKINIALLRNLRYQEINQVAIGKILKKFDKRTNLGVTSVAPKFIQFESIIPQTIAKAVCAQVTEDLVKITPQLDDYLCPICFTVAWRPIRLTCQHVFCVLCTIKMQKQNRPFCPLCREEVIMNADEDNYDDDLAKFLKKYFPKEIKQKQIELEKYEGEEKFGIYYKHPSESNSKCKVM